MSKFDDYAADRFVFRDVFRGIHSYIVFDFYMLTDKSGLYRSADVGLGEFRATDPVAFRQSAQRIKRAADSLAGYELNIYYGLVPDKSMFAEFFMPGFDMGLAQTILHDVLGDFSYVSLEEVMQGGHFYKTDLHWDQSQIPAVATHLLMRMDATVQVAPEELANLSFRQVPIHTAGDFFGVYAGQLAMPVTPDSMRYIDFPEVQVRYLNDRTLEFEPGPMYDFERFLGIDPYDFFLRGPQPLIVLENENAPEGRELYLFRDSFGSSLAPLLMSSYARITLIDLRYINLMILDQFVEFVPGSDVLFLYSSQIFNNPSILQS